MISFSTINVETNRQTNIPLYVSMTRNNVNVNDDLPLPVRPQIPT